MFIPDLTLKEILIKKIKFKRIIKKELLPPSQGYRTKHYLYLVSLKFTAQKDLKRQINEWFDSNSFLPTLHPDDSKAYREYPVIS